MKLYLARHGETTREVVQRVVSCLDDLDEAEFLVRQLPAPRL